MTGDLQNKYLYDPEGRVCAVQEAGGIVGYLYDAEGQRVAKGTLTSMSCDPTANGFSATNTYVIGPDGEEMTEVDKGTFVHINLSAAGELIATIKSDGPHFMLSDWLGTRRVQTDASGNVELTFQSQPFGDQIISSGTGTDATSRHFTGKERDAESGLDYFGARYYASSMGRWSSPDPSGLLLANPLNPQSFNLYSYVGNNPVRYFDPDGLSKDCGGGGDPSVVCMVTTAWDWLKSHVGGERDNSGGGGGNPPPGWGFTPPSSGHYVTVGSIPAQVRRHPRDRDCQAIPDRPIHPLPHRPQAWGLTRPHHLEPAHSLGVCKSPFLELSPDRS